MELLDKKQEKKGPFHDQEQLVQANLYLAPSVSTAIMGPSVLMIMADRNTKNIALHWTIQLYTVHPRAAQNYTVVCTIAVKSTLQHGSELRYTKNTGCKKPREAAYICLWMFERRSGWVMTEHYLFAALICVVASTAVCLLVFSAWPCCAVLVLACQCWALLCSQVCCTVVVPACEGRPQGWTNI